MVKSISSVLRGINYDIRESDKGLKIMGIASDSREVGPGYIFVAVKGSSVDGHDFVEEVTRKGAKVIIGEKKLEIKGATYIRVSDSREALGIIASNWFGDPSVKLKVIGVTGTDGKTTTTHLIYHLLTSVGKKAGLVSTIAAKIGDKEEDTGFHVTNPDPISLQRFLAQMVESGCEYAVVEVTSHGIAQKRIAGVNFTAAILTNITHEHLDYHKTFKAYRDTKLKLFQLAKDFVVLNKEDESYNYFSKILNNKKILSYQKADEFKGVLPGIYNELNAAGAVCLVENLGFNRSKLIKSLSNFELPTGRLQEITLGQKFRLYVDFAHTPNALLNVLVNLKSKTKGRLICVFGCAGERDKGKRFMMGKISVMHSDLAIFTAEDPRSESLSKIISKMVQGAKSQGAIEGKNFVRIQERGEAIAYALEEAKNGDTVVLCGKGHERSMAFSTFEHPWSDESTAINFLNRDKTISAIILAAGKGSRMKSALPKVIHEICGKPMVSYTIQNLRRAGMGEVVCVVSFKKNLVIPKIQGAVKIAVQKNPKGGTADAAKSGFTKVSKDSKIIVVINGDDSAFYSPETIKEIIKIHRERERKLTFVSLIKENPTGLGRVIRREDGLISKIVEEKDATPEERKIKEVNDGLYVFDKNWFSKNIKAVKKGPQGEFYLVDLVKLAIDQGDRMATFTLPDDSEWQGINTPEQLLEARQKMAKIINGQSK